MHAPRPFERKQKRPQGHCDQHSTYRGSLATENERKQKRPQGHCDFVYSINTSAWQIFARENKNARKGIATSE